MGKKRWVGLVCDFVLVVCKLENPLFFSLQKSGGDVISDDFKMAEKKVSSNFTNSSWFRVKKIWSLFLNTQ